MEDEEVFQLSKRGIFGGFYGFLYWGGIGFIGVCFGAFLWFRMFREVLMCLIGIGVVVLPLAVWRLLEHNSWEARIKRLMKSPQAEMLKQGYLEAKEVLSPGYPDTIKAGLYGQIDLILFFVWDPIGINIDEGDPWCEQNPDDIPRDEYYSYVPMVYDFLTSKPGKEKTGVYLEQIMAQYILKPEALQKEKCGKAAEKLAELKIS